MIAKAKIRAVEVLWLALAALRLLSATAGAHGVAGNRLFPGTISFDDAAVADEALLPAVSRSHPPAPEGGHFTDTAVPASFTRLLTRNLALSLDGSWSRRERPDGAAASGFGTPRVGLKSALYRSDARESLVAAGLSWAIGGLGDPKVGARSSSALQPGVFFGQGLDPLPEAFAWLRPLAVAGAVAPEFSLGGGGSTDVLHWSLALELSSFYWTKRHVHGAPPRSEPVEQWIPLVELPFHTPLTSPGRRTTTGTINPGAAYVSDAWQLVAEAIIPLNETSGRRTGALVQMIFFLDDLLPSAFARPLLTDR